jgi:hypothetical protein
LMSWCCYERDGRVFRAEASVANASAWVVSCPTGSLGLLTSIAAS